MNLHQSSQYGRFREESLDAVATITGHRRSRRVKAGERDEYCYTDEELTLWFWIHVVGYEFDEIWSTIYNAKRREIARLEIARLTGQVLTADDGQDEEVADDDDGDADDDDDDDIDNASSNDAGIRTCSATLKQVLRPELRDDPEAFSRIVELLEQKQELCTDLADQIYCLVHKGTLLIASGAMWKESSEPFDIGSLLPTGFQLTEESRNVNISPLPIGLQQEIEEAVRDGSASEMVNVFSQNHLNKLVTHFSKVKDREDNGDEVLGAATATSSNSTDASKLKVEEMDDGSPSFWTRLSRKILLVSDDRQPMPSRSGLSKIAESHVRQCSTEVSTLWDGSIYAKSLDYLLRFLLRAWLAPNREAATKQRKAQYAADKNALEQARLTRIGGRLTPSHWRHSMRRLCDELADCNARAGRSNTDAVSLKSRESAIRRRQ
ncbi:hypothetical protein DFQ27_001381, partial [Actinomortierella ambigua]